ncbi:hypothetical protein [Kitasatospora sp. NBC_00458]|uniref:hypothetical protein n=1 Tax=Kitasatospora sp. NBC_00458 TaxID=2903568 RepID=UPI002E193DC4
MYSYDVPAAHRRSATASRAIPGMRPSYDAEHPHSTTPIYDELYSEYRRLFRALPGDRSGEENLKFAGFAVRDGYPVLAEPRPYPPQQQAFHTYAGQAIGIPQFMPSQQGGSGGAGQHGQSAPHDPTGHHTHTGHTGHTGQTGQVGHHTHGGPGSHTNHPGAGLTAAPTGDGSGHHPGHNPGQGFSHGAAVPVPVATQPATATAAAAAAAAAQFGTGQGWVAAGYLGPVPHPMPLPAPAPAMGAGFGHAPGPAAGGRHRSMLSLPPGRSGDQH